MKKLLCTLKNGTLKLWNEVKDKAEKLKEKTQHLSEDLLLISQFGILVLTVMLDFTGLRCYMLFIPKIEQDIASAFLQVDATILTLTIALVSIMSGALSNNFMGISYSDYFLNIKPKIFTQKLIIIESLILFGIGCLSFWLSKHYIVAGILLCEITLVIKSTLLIYKIFSGEGYIRNEIGEYSLTTQFESKDVQDLFISASSKVLKNGDASEFEEYIQPLNDIVFSVWERRNDENSIYTLEELAKNCGRLLNTCANSDNKISKVLFLRLINEIYETLFNSVVAEGILNLTPSKLLSRPRKHRKFFNVINFSNIYSFFTEIFSELDVEVIQKTMKTQNFHVLLYRMQVVDLALFVDSIGFGKNYETIPLANELNTWQWDDSVKYMQKFAGWYIAEQIRKGNIPDTYYWTHDILLYKLGNITPEIKRVLDIHLSAGDALYTCGLIVHGLFDLAMKKLQQPHIQLRIRHSNVIDVVVPQCFLYYVSLREDPALMKEGFCGMVFDFARKFASDYDRFIRHNDISTFLIYELRSENLRDVNGNFVPHYMLGIIKEFDFRMENDNNNFSSIVSDVVRDFCLFSILYNHLMEIGALGTYGAYHEDGLSWLDDYAHRLFDFTDYINKGNNTEEKIKGFVNFMNPSMPDDKAIELAKRMYTNLYAGINLRYKYSVIKQAKRSKSRYITNLGNIRIAIRNLKARIENEIAKRFGENLFIDTNEKVKYYRTVSFIRHVSTEYLCSPSQRNNIFSQSFIEGSCGSIINNLIYMSIKRGALNKRRRVRYYSEYLDYIRYLKDNDLNLMMGSKIFLTGYDHRISGYFNENSGDYRWIIANQAVMYGAALKRGSVHFFIRNIEVQVKDGNINSEYGITNLGNGFYNYEIDDQKFMFRKRELQKFLHDEKKIIEVSADIGINVFCGNAGIYFTAE